MTKEELIKKIDAEIAKLSDNASQMCEDYEGYRLACKDISDVFHEIAKEIQPSLPSDLDEAAEEASQSAYSEPTAAGYAKRCFFKSGFKAGAEWMAGQGCTVEIDEGYFINNPQHDIREGKFHKYYSSTFDHSKKIVLTTGDEVVVQIRKK